MQIQLEVKENHNWFKTIFTWKEHIKVSSTDIIPPALSNSPQ